MTTQEIALRKQNVADFFNNDRRKQQLAAVLPKIGITPERMLQVAFNAFNTTPKLLECTPQSLFKSLVQCASLGLEPNTPLGQAYLLPFKNNKTNSTDVQLIIGYKGFLSLSRRSGELRSMSSHVVYKGDQFEYKLGTDEKIDHVPCGETDDNKITHAYAVANFKDGGYAFEVMTISQIKSIQKRSKSSGVGPWVTDFAQMCRKTVIRRLMNYLPLSIEIQRAVAVDSQNEAGVKDLSEFTGVIDAEYTQVDDDGNGEDTEAAEPRKSKLEQMAEGAA